MATSMCSIAKLYKAKRGANGRTGDDRTFPRNDNGTMNWKQTSIAEVQTAVRHANPSATELAELCFAEIEAQNAVINAILR